jgi:hypothetical protein
VDTVAIRVIAEVLDGGHKHLDLITGQHAPRLDSLWAKIALKFSNVALEIYDGGQPHYPLLVVAE